MKVGKFPLAANGKSIATAHTTGFVKIVANAQAWGVLDCICRVQKALIGEACQHIG